MLETIDWSGIDDPARDGWASEAFHGRASAQLALLAAALSQEGGPSEGGLAALVAEGFVCTPFVGRELVTTFDRGRLRVRRAEPGALEAAEPVEAVGVAALVRALAPLVAPFERGGPHGELHVKFKPFDVALGDDGTVETRQYVSLDGPTAEGVLERHGTWRIRWRSAAGDEPPRMERIVLEAYEESAAAGGALFADRTGAVLGDLECFGRQLGHGFHYWAQRLPSRDYFDLLGTPALALGDVDGDGRDDLFVGQQAGLPNLLLRQDDDGRVVDVSAAAGVDWLESARGALLCDLDGDGDQDLALGIHGAVIVAANDGSGRFEIARTVPVSDDVMSLAAADVDLDGDLDLYVCTYIAALEPGEQFFGAGGSVYYDAEDGGANHLLRNEGGLRFADATAELGLDEHNSRYSFAAAFEDYDQDGDPDLYVANDFGRNNLYRNDEGHFVDVAAAARVEDQASGMSVAWGDYDRDGWMDLYVSNMYSSAGNRITAQEGFMAEAPASVRASLRRFARGNTLFRSERGGTFADESLAAGVNVGRWAWGSGFVDLDNDGWEDLVVANGYITTEDTGDL